MNHIYIALNINFSCRVVELYIVNISIYMQTTYIIHLYLYKWNETVHYGGPWWKSATCFTIPNYSHMARLDNHVEHSCVLNGRSLPLVEDSPCDSDPQNIPQFWPSFFFTQNVDDTHVFFSKCRSITNHRVVSKHIDGQNHLAAAKTESISKSIVGMCWATSQASQKWRLARVILLQIDYSILKKQI